MAVKTCGITFNNTYPLEPDLMENKSLSLYSAEFLLLALNYHYKHSYFIVHKKATGCIWQATVCRVQ